MHFALSPLQEFFLLLISLPELKLIRMIEKGKTLYILECRKNIAKVVPRILNNTQLLRFCLRSTQQSTQNLFNTTNNAHENLLCFIPRNGDVGRWQGISAITCNIFQTLQSNIFVCMEFMVVNIARVLLLVRPDLKMCDREKKMKVIISASIRYA